MDELQKELDNYCIEMKSFLPIEEQLKRLKRIGKSIKDIKEILGNDSYIFDYVPEILYHGSPESLDIINPNESTQKGVHVYATDNPVHALFFSIFRNSSIARAQINEHINDNGNYEVKYNIDERVKGALDNIITDKNITIHVCDGRQFFKPNGEQYISREWISKDGEIIKPIKKINVNVKQFFENLEKQGLVEYDRYDKTKDWKTVIDMMGQNYPFGLNTDRAKDIDSYDSLYDEFIGTNFPEQLEFSKKCRSFIKKVMSTNYKLEKSDFINEQDYKLRYIKNTVSDFLKPYKDKILWLPYFFTKSKTADFILQPPSGCGRSQP